MKKIILLALILIPILSSCKNKNDIEEVNNISINEENKEHLIHDFTDPTKRILYYRGQGEFIDYITVCKDCDIIDYSPNSLCNYQTATGILKLDSYKVIYLSLDNNITFKGIDHDKYLVLGDLNTNVTLITDPNNDVSLDGIIDIINGKLILKGNVTINGTINVYDTLIIDENSNVNILGNIYLYNDAKLINNGTLNGEYIRK